MDALKKSRLIALAITTILPATGARAGGPHFVHHDEQADHEEENHYSDKGEHPSKAERLGVVVQSRVLIDKAGKSDFELTTGKLDSTATPPGNIDKLEVVALRPGTPTKGEERDDKAMFEKEYHHLRAGGYAHYTYANLVRGQTLMVEAKLSGFGNRKSHSNESDHQRVEVELADVVKYRPDLAVEKLDYPTTAKPNVVVPFAAVVSERMHDVGGHADCVLLVDGVQVDAAKAIWVDAGSSVSCSFGHRFTTVGAHTVTVRAQNGLPGDYDTSNNELSGQIVIKNPANLFYFASALDSTSTSEFISDYYYSSASTVPDVHSRSSYSASIQSRHFYGHIPLALSLPLKKVGYADSSDGAALTALSFTDVPADRTGRSWDPAFTTESVIERYDAASGAWLTIRRYENANTGAGTTTMDVSWYGGVVTYVSEYYCKAATGYPCAGGDYTPNPQPPSAFGSPAVKLGANYAADVVLDDGTAYAAHPKMALVPMNQSSPASSYCFVMAPGKICQQFSASLIAKSGNDALVE